MNNNDNISERIFGIKPEKKLEDMTHEELLEFARKQKKLEEADARYELYTQMLNNKEPQIVNNGRPIFKSHMDEKQAVLNNGYSKSVKVVKQEDSRKKKSVAASRITALILTIIMATTAGVAIGDKIVNTIQVKDAVSKIEKQKVNDLKEYLASLGLNANNIEKNLNNYDILTVDDDLYSYYLYFRNEMKLSPQETTKNLDELVHKMGFDNFGLYLKNRGYIDLRQPDAPHGSVEVWLNFMEGTCLKEAERSTQK